MHFNNVMQVITEVSQSMTQKRVRLREDVPWGCVVSAPGSSQWRECKDRRVGELEGLKVARYPLCCGAAGETTQDLQRNRNVSRYWKGCQRRKRTVRLGKGLVRTADQWGVNHRPTPCCPRHRVGSHRVPLADCCHGFICHVFVSPAVYGVCLDTPEPWVAVSKSLTGYWFLTSVV